MFCFPVKFFGETADKRVVEGVCPDKRNRKCSYDNVSVIHREV